jgi:hypothetical protein
MRIHSPLTVGKASSPRVTHRVTMNKTRGRDCAALSDDNCQMPCRRLRRPNANAAAPSRLVQANWPKAKCVPRGASGSAKFSDAEFISRDMAVRPVEASSARRCVADAFSRRFVRSGVLSPARAISDCSTGPPALSRSRELRNETNRLRATSVPLRSSQAECSLFWTTPVQ